MLKVLIVDDSPILRRTMRTYLEEHPGMQVCGEAGNGEEAVAKFRQLRPDFVILDFAMPVMNGIEAARRISSLAPSVPLVMFTLFKSDQLTREAQEAGIDRVLSKGGVCRDAVEEQAGGLAVEMAGGELLQDLHDGHLDGLVVFEHGENELGGDGVGAGVVDEGVAALPAAVKVTKFFGAQGGRTALPAVGFEVLTTMDCHV